MKTDDITYNLLSNYTLLKHYKQEKNQIFFENIHPI